MTIIKFPQKQPQNEPPFFKDIKEDGYHVYSLENAKKPKFYPPELPEYPGVPLEDLKEDDIITIRVFFGTGKGKNMRVDGGHITLKAESIYKDRVLAAITTDLPDGYPLSASELMLVFAEEILSKSDSKEQ